LKNVKAGVTTDELNTLCHNHIVEVQQAIPAPLNYHGFPKSICTSVNDVICHGIPNHKKLREGDIINLDITVIKDGYHGDTSASCARWRKRACTPPSSRCVPACASQR